MSKKKQRINEDRLNTLFSTLQGELGDLRPSEGFKAFAVDRLMGRMRKRAAYHKPSLRSEAFEKFLNINLKVSSLELTLDERVLANARYFILNILERYTSSVNPVFVQETLDLDHLYSLWTFGPGASNGVVGTHTAEKVSQNMTCTDSSVPWLSRLRRSNPYFLSFDARNGGSGLTLVRGSRLTTVPKNEETERTIAIEPSGNMCLQLAAGRYLEGALRLIGLDLSDQQFKNKRLAMEGSKVGGIATIDLQSASDMIAIDLVRALFPDKWFRLLMDLRSPVTEIAGLGAVEMKMISTMGNGFTFPLMTFIIVSLIYGFRCTKGGPNLFIDWSKTCVFGDDIIIPDSEYSEFTGVLRAAGLVVNYDKSYSSGPFRESCGGDYWCGEDVSPFYIKSLSTDSQIYTAINQVFEWCGRMRILLHQTLIYLGSLLTSGPYFVPEWSQPFAGIKTTQCKRRYKYLAVKQRYRRLREEHFAFPLAAGGYIESLQGNNLFYLPRPFKNEVKVVSGRLPNGFLDGRSPLDREHSVSDFIGAYSFILGR